MTDSTNPRQPLSNDSTSARMPRKAAGSTRRHFLKTASAGAAATLTASSYARVIGANDRISIGLIGCGRRGYAAHMGGVHPYDKDQNVEFTAVSDPWRQKREQAAQRCKEWYGRKARAFVSYRDIMALDDIDAVMIASCDHHHCAHLVAAAKAKKHAYCEKPLGLYDDMASLRNACDAVKDAGIVVQMGTQVRSWTTSAGCKELFKTGIIGKVSRIEQRRNGTKPYWYSRLDEAKAEDVDFKEFLMDKPDRPFDAKWLTGWYGYRDFTDGPIANLGCHFIDLLHYIVGASIPHSAVAQGKTYTWKDKYAFTCPDHCQASWEYPEGFIVSYATNFGNANGNVLKIYGDEGVIDLSNWRAPTYSAAGAIKETKAPKKPEKVKPVERPDNFLDWLQCMRTGKTPNAPIEAGYAHSVAVMMATVAMDTGKRQVYDPAKRDFHAG